MEQHKCRKIKCEEIGEVGWVFYLYMPGLSTYKQTSKERQNLLHIHRQIAYACSLHVPQLWSRKHASFVVPACCCFLCHHTHTHDTPDTPTPRPTWAEMLVQRHHPSHTHTHLHKVGIYRYEGTNRPV